MTSLATTMRNRRNAQRSTGPRSAAGKAVARRNSLKHGLTANPAVGVVEDAGAYENFYARLIEQIQPQCLIEQCLVDRIAVSLWRLYRAMRAETAVTGLAVSSIKPMREDVQAWIRDIHEAWQPRLVQITDRAEIREAVKRHEIEPGQTLVRTMRPGLRSLQRMFDRKIMASASGLSAVILMTQNFYDRLSAQDQRMAWMEVEIFAWLLGVPVHCFPLIVDDPSPASSDGGPASLLQQIEHANRRDAGQPISPALSGHIESRLAMFQQQRCVVADPSCEAEHRGQQESALLPEAPILDRLLRYETHAERSLMKSLEQLANLRGTSVDAMKSRYFSENLFALQADAAGNGWNENTLFGQLDSAKRSQMN